tara:strand:+ start:824 stop:964 length:141 start_codon:yes stop_codon:yes gene_type:complete
MYNIDWDWFLMTINGFDLTLIAIIIALDHYRRYWKNRATKYYMGGK